MKRAVAGSILALAAATLLGVVLVSGRRVGDRADSATAARSDSVWYHASDVALLAKTGRPQLVEFFHPG